MVPTRPILRYHGGKWLLAKWIISHFPKHRIYVEPFGGAASVLLQKSRTYGEVYNDLDQDVVNLFRVARDRSTAQELIRRLALTPFARVEFVDAYSPTEDPIEKARKLIIRAFMGYSSNGHSRKTGFRSNSNRSGTTPAHDWVNYPSAFEAIIERLQGVTIECKPAIEVMTDHDTPKTLFYLDPPYLKSTRDPGDDYRHEMTEQDHIDLSIAVADLRGMVAISGYDCELYDHLYSGWQKVYRSARADGARKRTEVLWLSPNAKRQPTLFEK